jgi:glycerol-3-phosphate dehydrogenase
LENAARTQFWECAVVDKLTNQSVPIRARTVVNATGPWADGLPHSAVKLRLTKGVHIVVDHARVPVPDTVVMTEGKRILCNTLGERTILGTTDTDYAGNLDRVLPRQRILNMCSRSQTVFSRMQS